MSIKNEVINAIIKIEGGYVNNPNDSGGATKYGITEKVARKNGYKGNMKDLQKQFAFTIYAKRYWKAVKASEIEMISQSLAREVVDTGVNMGTGRAGKFLQRSLNVLNDKERYYMDLVVDGDIGPATINALKMYDKFRDVDIITKMCNALQGAFYVTLAEKRKKDETFIYGWFKHRI